MPRSGLRVSSTGGRRTSAPAAKSKNLVGGRRLRSYCRIVSTSIDAQQDEALHALRARLLSDRPPPLRTDQGQLAFMQHVLLAPVIHNAARLNQHSVDNQTGAWIRYFMSYFPPGKNSERDARLLWTDWRTDLLKKQAPGSGVVVTHGQPAVHWRRDELGRLCINLEDMWADFESSVDAFVEHLHETPDRRRIALRRARESAVAIIQFTTTVPTISAPASGCAPPAQVATGSAVAHTPTGWFGYAA